MTTRLLVLIRLAAVLWLMSAPALADLPPWQAPEGREHPRLGQILETASGRWLSAEELVERLVTAPRVLVGEKHDNPDHHALQLWLLKRLHARREQSTLVMEMLAPAQQQLVDTLQREPLPEDPQLAHQLNWNEGWDWMMYGPLVRWGLTYPQRLQSANLDRGRMLDLYRRPEPLSEVYDAAAREKLTVIMRDAHCGKLPEAHVPAMLSIQQARDRRMGEALLGAAPPAMLLAGSFHARRDLGVPLHWPHLEPAPLVVILNEAGGEMPGIEQADFVWMTPATPARDYCQDFRRK